MRRQLRERRFSHRLASAAIARAEPEESRQRQLTATEAGYYMPSNAPAVDRLNGVADSRVFALVGEDLFERRVDVLCLVQEQEIARIHGLAYRDENFGEPAPGSTRCSRGGLDLSRVQRERRACFRLSAERCSAQFVEQLRQTVGTGVG